MVKKIIIQLGLNALESYLDSPKGNSVKRFLLDVRTQQAVFRLIAKYKRFVNNNS